jgi:hypothetical protein
MTCHHRIGEPLACPFSNTPVWSTATCAPFGSVVRRSPLGDAEERTLSEPSPVVTATVASFAPAGNG